MMPLHWPRTYRTRFFLVVLGVAVIPLALMGFWLLGSVARSGERLLRAQLVLAMERTETEIGRQWLMTRSRLLDLTESVAVRRALARQEPVEEGSVDVPGGAVLPGGTAEATVYGLDGRPLLEVSDPDRESLPPGYDYLVVELPLYASETGEPSGVLRAAMDMRTFVESSVSVPGAAGVLVGAFKPEGGGPLLSIPFNAEALTAGRFLWAGEEWLSVSHSLFEPRVDLVVAAPVGLFTRPVSSAARQGAWLLGGVAAGALLLTFVLTRRLTQGLRRLADAADAVSKGDLRQTTGVDSEDEVGRVARAFDHMTTTLDRTLGELAEREAQAAMGEFAASLAHEVRNPLTAIRLDMQMVEEQLGEYPEIREAQRRALEEIVRLDETVGRGLDTARKGQLGVRRVSIGAPVEAAARAAAPAFAEVGARLQAPVEAWPAAEIRGEPGSLEQLFLNILLNAAQALGSGGMASVDLGLEEAHAVVSIIDDGPGISPEVMERLFEPFFSTHPKGTGLGMSIAQRIATAHGGSIEVDNPASGGTVVKVRLPRVGTQ
jgi:signal transduction histidine kinase